MRIALIIPEDTPPTGGNNISAQRMQLGLMQEGYEADVLLYQSGIRGYDVYHAWNATRVGARLVEDGVNPEQIVATWTGTDLWQDWVADPAGQRQRLESIRFQVVFTDDARSHLLRNASDWADRVMVIPPSVDVEHFDLKGPNAECAHPLILVAGGVRPVKRSSWAIDLVDALRQESGLDYQLAIAGPVRETGEWDRVAMKAQGREWVHLVGNRSREEMPSWYRCADIFLNTSAVEGVSNAIMEAMACGALVLVSDIAGNRALVSPGQTGLLFHDQSDFIDQMNYIQAHPVKMAAIRAAARRQIVSRYSIQQEAQRYVRLYEGCLSVRGCCR